MGKRAKLRFGTHIKQYMHSLENSPNKPIAKVPLDLEVKKPLPGAKPRNPAAHPWRYTGQAKGRIFKDVEPVPFDQKVDVPFGVCFNCWQYSHQQSNCTKPTLDDHCQNCGRIGVKVSNCPRCRKAYLVYRKKNIIKQAYDAKSSPPANENEKKQMESVISDEYKVPLDAFSTIEDDFVYYYEHFSHDEEFSCNEFDDLSKIIVDETMESDVITGDFLDNFLNLINAMQFLPVQKKTEIAQKYFLEHRRQLLEESIQE